MRYVTCVLGLCLVAAWSGVVEGAVVVNGDFEVDPPETQDPCGWTYTTNDPQGWDGVTLFNAHASQFPPVRPNGGSQCYGDLIDGTLDGVGGSTARLTQVIDNPEQDLPKQITVGLSVWSLSSDGAVRISLDQAVEHLDGSSPTQVSNAGVHWESPWLSSQGSWSPLDFTIPATAGFRCADFVLTIDLKSGITGPPIPGFDGLRGVWVDGIWIEDVCVPEPLTLSLIAGGLVALRLRRRK